MTKTLLLLAAFFCLSVRVNAAHIIGGEMRYEYVGPGAAPNSKIFRIVMILFKGDATGMNVADLDDTYPIAIFNNDNGQKFPGNAVNQNWLINKITGLPHPSVPIVFPQCIQNAPVLDYRYAIYSIVIELPNTFNGYTATFQTCCRINGLMNVANNTGSTYTCRIPGTNQIGSNGDNAPQFGLPVNVICRNAPFVLNFGAIDPDTEDSLVYSLCNAYNGGLAINSGFNNPAPPPYGSANYLVPFSGGDPFGTGATINSQTGVISGMAPELGKYVVSVCIDVYHDGVLIATHRKDLIVQVSDCTVAASNPMPEFVTCDGFNVQFAHTSTGANSVYWDFGVASTISDTSNIDSPTFTYTDTGTYKVKLVINRGTGCVDSTFRNIGVYPGFFPNFGSIGTCLANPVQFRDSTTTNYGSVNGWNWNFGDLATLADTSRIQNPTWVYADTGIKSITLIARSTKGCVDTVSKTIHIIDKPVIGLPFRDTLICVPDALQLQATGTGSFSWSPPINIINANTATPTVNPTSTTIYHIQLDEQGCINHDSVRVRVVDVVSLAVRPDTVICLTDSIRLDVVSDGLRFLWDPAATLNDPTLMNPVATPVDPLTRYHVVARIGSCITEKWINIATVPYPIANAGEDEIVCYNKSVILNGVHNGNVFSWSPTNSLLNANTLQPTAFPPRTTQYILTVTSDNGCPKPSSDTVLVTVRPKIIPFAGHDTMVVVNQPLQLNAQGGTGYQWIPATGLNNPLIPNPIGKYGAEIDSVRYTVMVFDDAGCVDSSHVTVRVFKTNPSVFVPTAFTPNGDGLNDLIRPIAVGIKQINYFSIYNRWGQLVFRTSVNGKGWDGTIQGKPQGSNVYVWMVSAVDYLDKPVFLKGTLTLVR